MWTREGNRPCTVPVASGSFRRHHSPHFAKGDQDLRSLCSRLDSPIVEGRACWLVPIDSDILPRRSPALHPYKDSTATCGMYTPVLQERLSIDCNCKDPLQLFVIHNTIAVRFMFIKLTEFVKTLLFIREWIINVKKCKRVIPRIDSTN